MGSELSSFRANRWGWGQPGRGKTKPAQTPTQNTREPPSALTAAPDVACGGGGSTSACHGDTPDHDNPAKKSGPSRSWANSEYGTIMGLSHRRLELQALGIVANRSPDLVSSQQLKKLRRLPRQQDSARTTEDMCAEDVLSKPLQRLGYCRALFWGV